MSLRDRIARVLCANSPANTEGSAFEDYAECNQREWLETADAILAETEIAALREVAESVIEEVAAERDFDPASGHRDRRGAARRITAAKSRKYAAIARLEEARRG